MNQVSGTRVSLRICLTFDVDGVSLWTGTFRTKSPSDVSRGEFAALAGVPRVLDLLSAHDIPATFFVPAVTAGQFRATIMSICAAGHEIGAHGDLHERLVEMDRSREAEVHRRSIAVLGDLAGAAPAGFRAPGWELSINTIEILAELGFLYDSSQMGTDFVPYRARRGDRIEEAQWSPGEPTNVWEVPVSWELDDFPAFFIKPPHFMPSWTNGDIATAWRHEFDFALANVPDGVFTLTLHPEIIGRGPRLEMLSQFIDYIAKHPGVEFATMRHVAQSLAARDRE
jgi:peptidoglycan/xylan/chitin deacetylase (PgdA/CDA1 family)